MVVLRHNGKALGEPGLNRPLLWGVERRLRSSRQSVALAVMRGHTVGMAKPAVDISALTPDERVDLIGELWDSLDALPPTLSEDESEELRRRVERVQRDGVTGVTIDELRTRLLRS